MSVSQRSSIKAIGQPLGWGGKGVETKEKSAYNRSTKIQNQLQTRPKGRENDIATINERD